MMDAAQSLVSKKRRHKQMSQEPSSLTSMAMHCINLAASDSMETSRIVIDALETTHEITRHIKYSPKRNAKLKQIRKSSEGQLQC